MKSVPGKYFKYRQIGKPDSIERIRLRQVIVDSDIYFAKPCELNDPFDCAPIAVMPEVAAARKSIQRMVENVCERKNVTATKEQKSKLVSQAMLRLKDPVARNKLMFDVINMNTAVFCMSANSTNSLQWSKYGDSHTGVCLEFEIPDNSEWFVMPVEYTKIRPTIDITSFHEDSGYRLEKLGEAVSAKSEDWRHEQEFRAFHYTAGNKKFDPGQLVSVTFGLATPDEYINYVMSLLKASLYNPALFRCKANIDAYGVMRESFSA